MLGTVMNETIKSLSNQASKIKSAIEVYATMVIQIQRLQMLEIADGLQIKNKERYESEKIRLTGELQTVMLQIKKEQASCPEHAYIYEGMDSHHKYVRR